MSIMHLMSKEVALTTSSLIANNSASRAAECPVGTLNDDTCSPSLQKWAADIAYMFLEGITLASVTTTSVEGSVEALWQRWSRTWKWALIVLSLKQSQGWKETRSEKLSNNLHSGWASEWSGSKHSIRLSKDASVSKRGLLNWMLWASVRRASDYEWGQVPFELWVLRRDISACWEGRVAALRQDHLTSFLRWR